MQSGARCIRFMDDTFTSNRGRVIEICKLLIEKNVNVVWSCLARTDTVDDELLAWMHRAGCRRILVGIESYSVSVLKRLNKRIHPSTINPQLQRIHDAGIQIVGHFLVGAPFETEEDFAETLRGALASPIDLIIVNILTPYAGTPYFDDVRELINFNLLPYN